MTHLHIAYLTLALSGIATILAGCSNVDSDFTLGEEGEQLHVTVRTGFTSWYFQDDQPTGLEYDLLQQFAQHASKILQVHFVPTAEQAFTSLKQQDVAIATGTLTLPTSYSDYFIASTNYLSLKHELIHRYTQPPPRTHAELVMKNIDVGNNPAHLETLTTIKRANNDATNWSLNPQTSPHELLDLTDKGIIHYAVMDSTEMMLLKPYYPRIKQAFAITDELPVSWIINKENTQLVTEINNFFETIKTNKKLANIIDRYYGHVELLNYPSRLTVVEKFQELSSTNTLKLFQKAGKKFALDWKLIAAISYHESLWNPAAKSPSGVIGMMMITHDIAQQFNVTDRLEPESNINAGIQYFLQLKQRLPDSIQEPERTWYAMVAYNAGYRYLQKAMRKTTEKNLDASLWINLRETLQEIQSTITSKQVKNMPVNYVYSVRAYYDLINWLNEGGPIPQRESNGEPLLLHPELSPL